MNFLRPLLAGTLIFAAFCTASVQAASKLPSAQERDDTVKLQVFLDRSMFGPGKIDGLTGEFTTKAITLYQQAHQLDADGLPENLPIPRNAPVYTTYTIRQEDLKFVGDIPSKPSDQSKKKYLPYGSLLEFLTERFHCSAHLLAWINPELDVEKLKVDDSVRVPDVEPFLIEEIRCVGSIPELPEFKTRSIEINRKERLLQLKDGTRIVAAFPITPGSETLPTPPGKWRIVGISTMPTFRWDEGVLNHGIRTSEFFMLPSGPNNPVGVAWCALSKPGIGIHGTNHPDTIGRAQSHGCMRVANWDVIRLVKEITSGMLVVIE